MKTEQVIKRNITGATLIDFGKEAFARLSLDLKGKAGTKVAVSIGEKLTAGGALDTKVKAPIYFHREEIILEDGQKRYEFYIPEHKTKFSKAAEHFCRVPADVGGEVAPFRHVFIEGYTGEAAVIRTSYTYDFDDAESDFSCSNDDLNRIWDFCKYSIKATSTFGMFIDGDRERFPYEADSFINQLGWFGSSTRFKIARDTIERFLFFYPTWLTEYNLVLPMLVQDYILYSGDTDCLKEWYEPLKKILHPEMEDTDGLLRATDNVKDIIDWPEVERDNYEMGKVNFVPNAFFYGALLTMAQLGNDEFFRKKAENVRSVLRRTMMKNGMFTDHPDSNHTSLHTAMYAIYYGVAEPAEITEMMKFIRAKGMACSVYGAYYLLACCFLNGAATHGLDLMTSHDLRSWNNMLAKGATITMEAWDVTFKPNQDWNHAWGAAPAAVIPRYLCGIRPIAPGFREFVFDPHFEGLKKVNFRQPTVRGPITVDAQEQNIRLTIPEGTRCFYGKDYLGPGTHELTIK